MKRLLLGLFMVALSASFVYAYVPSIHMQEAGTYKALCYLIPSPGPEHDPVVLESNIWFLRLGSIWPDIAHGAGPEGQIYFTTDWSLYTQIEEIDFTKDAYTLQYSSYDHWPYSLKVLSGKTR